MVLPVGLTGIVASDVPSASSELRMKRRRCDAVLDGIVLAANKAKI